MKPTQWLPLVEVGVALIRRQNRILVIYNPQWGAMTLPMIKRKRWLTTPDAPVEAWNVTCARAAVECLGRTVFLAHESLMEKTSIQHSDREGSPAEYHFHVSLVEDDLDTSLVPGVIGEWLTVEEVLDPARLGLSPTVLEIVADLHTKGQL